VLPQTPRRVHSAASEMERIELSLECALAVEQSYTAAEAASDNTGWTFIKISASQHRSDLLCQILRLRALMLLHQPARMLLLIKRLGYMDCSNSNLKATARGRGQARSNQCFEQNLMPGPRFKCVHILFLYFLLAFYCFFFFVSFEF